MLLKISEAWTKITTYARSRGKWFSYLLSLASFIYLAALLAYGGRQLWAIQWTNYILPSVGVLALHFISSVVQYFVWARLIAEHHQAGWQDIAIYSRVLMLRRLPGGAWHWVGRTAMYADTTKVPAKVAALGNFVEWALLLLTAGSIACAGIEIFPPALRFVLAAILFGLAIGIGYVWQSSARSWVWRLVESVAWVLMYGFAWWLGGVIIYWYAQVTMPKIESAHLEVLKALWIWAIAGGGSMIVIFLPSGLGIRELSLTWLLLPYLPPAGALIVALLVRFVFTLADFLWGTLGWGLSNWLLRRTRSST